MAMVAPSVLFFEAIEAVCVFRYAALILDRLLLSLRLALDINLPSGQLGGEARILAFDADSERQLDRKSVV